MLISMSYQIKDISSSALKFWHSVMIKKDLSQEKKNGPITNTFLKISVYRAVLNKTAPNFSARKQMIRKILPSTLKIQVKN